MRSRLIAAFIAAAAASACSHMPEISSMMPSATTISVTPDLAPRERVRVAIELLGEGDPRRAKAELEAALETARDLPTARRLLEQIDGSPAALLAGPAAPYTVRTGETMSVLAERFQGDALLFYALARFNGIEAPNQVTAGQTLMIPRRPGVRIAAVSDRAPETPVPPSPVSRGADSQRANRMRLQALQFLNSGQVDQAVALLRSAQALDTNNAAIHRDLDRAQRLQTSLRSADGAR